MIKYSTLTAGLILSTIFFSCNKPNDEKAEIVTNNYVRFVDSVVKKGNENGIKNWNSITKEYDKKSNELYIEIDKLEDNTILDEKINTATAKYERFRNQTFEAKLERETNEEEFL